MKKSQIATFFVIGLVVIILVGMVIYFTSWSTKRQGQKNVKITQQSTIRTQPVSNFINLCLEKVAKDGLVLAGRQAGYIFTDQKGPQTLTIKFFDKDGYHVAYAIPLPNQDRLIDLNKGESLANALSIQNQLEVYINNTIEDCADFTVLEKQGFKIKRSGKNTYVKISDNGVAVNLHYPIEVTYLKTGDKAHYENFNVNINAGLNKTYGVANNMIGRNYESPSKITVANYQELPRIVITDEEVNTPGVKDQLVVIKDSDTQIKGQNYEFWFVKENWQP